MTLKNKTTKTQVSEIIDYLKTGKGLTQQEAYFLIGTQRLASRIWDIHQKGHEIRFEWERVKNRHGRVVSVKRYWLAEHAPKDVEALHPEKSKAQKRYDNAHEILMNRQGVVYFYEEEALKIAAGL